MAGLHVILEHMAQLLQVLDGHVTDLAVLVNHVGVKTLKYYQSPRELRTDEKHKRKFVNIY